MMGGTGQIRVPRKTETLRHTKISSNLKAIFRIQTFSKTQNIPLLECRRHIMHTQCVQHIHSYLLNRLVSPFVEKLHF